jgi:hypothetical protein
MGGLTSSYAAAIIVLEFVGAHKTPHPATSAFDKLEIPLNGTVNYVAAK